MRRDGQLRLQLLAGLPGLTTFKHAEKATLIGVPLCVDIAVEISRVRISCRTHGLASLVNVSPLPTPALSDKHEASRFIVVWL